jgi:hypothetical protein
LYSRCRICRHRPPAHAGKEPVRPAVRLRFVITELWRRT